GGAYVPLDPQYPTERLRYQLADCGTAVLVTEREQQQRFHGYAGRVVTLDGGGLEEIASQSSERPASGVVPEKAAYVIYTSGSTGTPKGCVISHRNMAQLLAASEGLFQFGEEDVWTMFHSSAFDFSVWELWGALSYGGRLVVVSYWTSRSPVEFAALL